MKKPTAGQVWFLRICRVCGLAFLLQGPLAVCASVSQATFQSTVDKIHETQVATDQKVQALQSRFEDFLKTNLSAGPNAGLSPTQVTTLAQNAAETYFRSLDLNARIDTASQNAAKNSLSGVSNLVCRLETNLLTTIRAMLATNAPRMMASSAQAPANTSEQNQSQVMAALQHISTQVQALQASAVALQSRSDHGARLSFYAILAGDVLLLAAGLATAYFMWLQTAASAGSMNATLERHVQWFASNVQCVATAVSENLATQRAELTDHLRSLKTNGQTAVQDYERTLRGLHENTVAKLGELNRRLGSAGDEISTALRRSALELTGNRLEAELSAATVLWKQSFGQTLIEEQTRGASCLRQLRDEADGQLRKTLTVERAEAQAAARECVEDIQRQFRQTLETEIDSARRTWARHLEQERQILAKELDGFVQRQTDALKQSIQQMNQSLGAEFDRLKKRDAAFSTLLWPAFFHHGSLAGWRESIIEGATRHDPAAIDLMLALGRYNNAGRNGGDLRKLAEALHAVSLGAYQFWKNRDTKVLDASQEWKSAFQSALDAANTPLDIMLVLEGERFDMNTMLAADSGSGSRIIVREVLSWIVRDKSSQPAKVLCHGRVTTG